MLDVGVYLSGGAANTDPDLALGGAISSTLVAGQGFTWSPWYSGVTVTEAAGNALGAGTLTLAGDRSTLTWEPNGGTVGAAVAIPSDGNYLLADATETQFVEVAVVVASLPAAGSDTGQTLTITAASNSLFDDIAKAESKTGDVEYRCVYLKNSSAYASMVLSTWIEQNSTGPDSIAIGLDPAGLNGTAAAVVDEGTAPAGVTFTSPADLASALQCTMLAIGDTYALWIRRTVPPYNVENASAEYHLNFQAVLS